MAMATRQEELQLAVAKNAVARPPGMLFRRAVERREAAKKAREKAEAEGDCLRKLLKANAREVEQLQIAEVATMAEVDEAWADLGGPLPPTGIISKLQVAATSGALT